MGLWMYNTPDKFIQYNFNEKMWEDDIDYIELLAAEK